LYGEYAVGVNHIYILSSSCFFFITYFEVVFSRLNSIRIYLSVYCGTSFFFLVGVGKGKNFIFVPRDIFAGYFLLVNCDSISCCLLVVVEKSAVKL
jgi:hypothetical protein